MKKALAILALGLLVCSATLFAANGEVYFRFNVESVKQLPDISKLISIDNVRGDTVWAYATDTDFDSFKSLGFEYTVLPRPSTLIEHRMAKSPTEVLAWDSYPTYGTYIDMMEQYALDYPLLCAIDTIGTSVEGKLLLAARISDNVGVDEAEPEVFYTSSMHGDEVTGYVLMLRLIDYLLTNYGSDTQATNLVNNLQIWINPAANPDGTYASDTTTINGATRYNANWVDLNRNFPDPDDGQHPDGNAWQQETVAMMDFAEAHNFILSVNFHGGAQVVNYPWDTWSRRHPDDAWWIDISRRYADSAQANSPSGYMTDQNNGITNGWDWYTITGGRQDYMTYFRGGREVTIELSWDKNPPGSELPNFWNYNRAALLEWLENAYYGIRGIVTDSVTGLPLAATVTVLGHDQDADSSRVFSQADHGDYYRMIEGGTYDLYFKAPGYVGKTISGVTVADRSTTMQDVQLAPLTGDPVLSIYGYDIGLVDPGDTVDFHITLLNDGGGNGNSVTATLSSADGYINILQPASAYPTISAEGGTALSLSTFSFEVLSSCPSMHEATFQLDIHVGGEWFASDQFTILVGLPREDFESGDLSAYPWQTAGDALWSVVSGGVQSGAFCAVSGDISDNDSSRIFVTLDITEPGEISFYYKVSSESGWDYLSFYLDDVQKGRWSGTVNWAQISYPVTAGQHTFKWAYEKDGSQSNGSDCAWIDFVVFPPTYQTLTVITTSLPDWTVGHAYSQQLDAEGGQGARIWTDLNGDLTGSGLTVSGTGLLSGVPTITGSVSFIAHVVDEGSHSDDQPLSFMVNSHVNITTTSLPGGELDASYSQQLQITGGTGVKTWADKNGDLAAYGLSLSTDGKVTGTATAAGTIDFVAKATDSVGDVDEQGLSIEITSPYVCGDADGNEIVNIADAVYVISYIFGGGQAPDPLLVADADCNSIVNIADAVYLISYIFGGGAAPCASCKP